MIYRTTFIALSLLLQSCIDDINLQPIVPYHLLHANSCKVWVLEGVYQNGKNLTSPLDEEKKVFLFYDDNSLYIQKRILLGSKNAEKGFFNLVIPKEQKDTLLMFYFEPNEKISFKINYLDYRVMKLSRISSDEIWQFIVLPKPFL